MKNRVCGTSDVLSCDLLSLGKEHSVFLSEYTSKRSFPSMFFTRGTNVLAACRVPGIDKSTIELNNVISVEKYFGIEAAASDISRV